MKKSIVLTSVLVFFMASMFLVSSVVASPLDDFISWVLGGSRITGYATLACPGTCEWSSECYRRSGYTCQSGYDCPSGLSCCCVSSDTTTTTSTTTTTVPPTTTTTTTVPSCSGNCVASPSECMSTCSGGYCANSGCDSGSTSPCCCTCPTTTTTSTTTTTTTTTLTTLPPCLDDRCAEAGQACNCGSITCYAGQYCCEENGACYNTPDYCDTNCLDTTTTTTSPTEYTEEPIECNSGCIDDGKCLSFGIRKSGEYCSLSGEMADQKLGSEDCENSFECSSNACMDGKCIEQGLIQRIIEWILRFFSP